MPPAPQNTALWAGAACGTTMWQYMDMGRHCMWFPSWNVVVVVEGGIRALHLDSTGAPRTINQPRHHIHHRPHPKNTNQYPNLYLHSYSCLICGITCYATLVEWVYNYLNAITWQLIKSFFSNLNDLKVFIQFYWTQVWSFCIALSLTGAEESDMVIAW